MAKLTVDKVQKLILLYENAINLQADDKRNYLHRNGLMEGLCYAFRYHFGSGISDDAYFNTFKPKKSGLYWFLCPIDVYHEKRYINSRCLRPRLAILKAILDDLQKVTQ